MVKEIPKKPKEKKVKIVDIKSPQENFVNEATFDDREFSPLVQPPYVNRDPDSRYVRNKPIFIHQTWFGSEGAAEGNYSGFWIAPRKCTVIRAQLVFETATTAGSTTLDIEKLTGTGAPGSGNTVLQSTFTMDSAANTVQTVEATLTIADKNLDIGDRLAAVATGSFAGADNVTLVVEVVYDYQDV